MKLDPNDINPVNGYYDNHFTNHKAWTAFGKWWKGFWWSIVLLSAFVSICVIIYVTWGLPNGWDRNSIQGPIVSRINATIINSNYCSDCGFNGGQTHDSFAGIPNGRYMGNTNHQQRIVEKGDKVILNLNQNGDILSFVDITAGHRYCMDDADCEY